MPPSLPPDLHTVLLELARRLHDGGIPWVVTGSTGRALLGFDETPDEIDAEMPESAVPAAARLTGLALRRDADAHVSSIRAQGTVHGIGLDLCGGYTLHGPGGNLHADFPLMREYATPVDLGGCTVLVAPIEEQIARSVVAGAELRLDRIADHRPEGYRVNELYLSLRLAAASASR